MRPVSVVLPDDWEEQTGVLCFFRGSQSLDKVCIRIIGLGQRKDMGLAARRHLEEEFNRALAIVGCRKAMHQIAGGNG